MVAETPFTSICPSVVSYLSFFAFCCSYILSQCLEAAYLLPCISHCYSNQFFCRAVCTYKENSAHIWTASLKMLLAYRGRILFYTGACGWPQFTLLCVPSRGQYQAYLFTVLRGERVDHDKASGSHFSFSSDVSILVFHSGLLV